MSPTNISPLFPADKKEHLAWGNQIYFKEHRKTSFSDGVIKLTFPAQPDRLRCAWEEEETEML